MLATHLEAEIKYEALRKASLQAIAKQVDPANNLQFRLIDKQALAETDRWKISPNRSVDWEWSHYASFKSRYPKRFELALWNNSRLTSLSLGRPTYNASDLRLDFIEKNPDYDDIKVFQITLAAMNVYADSLGAKELRIMKPINDEVKRYYQTFGLQYVSKGDYLFTRI